MPAIPGRFNPVSLMLLLALAGGVWWAYVYVPLHFDHLTVKEVAAQAINVAVVSGPDSAAQQALVRLNREVGWHFEVDEETGEERRQPGLGLTQEQVEVWVDDSARTINSRIVYDRTVVLEPTRRRQVKHFVAEKTERMR